MVAASAEKEGLAPQTAVLCFAAIIVSFLLGLYLSEKISFLAQAPMPLPPEALADRAQQFLKSVGYADAPRDTASGFICCDYSNDENLRRLEPVRRAAILASHQPPVLHFWYRQHVKSFGPGEGPYDRPTETTPPNFEPGMVQVNLDATGRLLRLQVQPWKTDVANPEVHWPTLFSAAGLDFARFTSVPSDAIPPMAVDGQFAWRGSYSDDRKETVMVTGATWRGRPVLFDVREEQKIQVPATESRRLGQAASLLVLGSVMLFLAWRNWRSGRIDNRGAAGLTAVVFILSIATGHGYQSFARALLTWVVYTGIEPYARRYWPDSLISWSRVSQGRIRNPLVASHTLIAIGFSAVFSLLFFPQVRLLLPYTHALIVDQGLSEMGSVRFFVDGILSGIAGGLAYLALLVLGRMAFRRRLAADLVAALSFNALAFGILWVGYLEERMALALLFMIPSLTWIPLMRRFGFLTILVVWATQLATQSTPLKATGWMAHQLIVLHLIPVALAAWSLWVIVSAENRQSMESSRA